MLWVTAYITALTFFLLSLSLFWERRNSRRDLALKSSPLVSILIPAYRSSREIGATLQSIKASSYPRKEIIVVNDSPGDRTSRIARSYGARVLENQKRMGKGSALNRASRLAKGEFLLFLDSDTLLRKETLSILVASHQEYESSGERVGMIAPRYILKNRERIVPRITSLGELFTQALYKIQMAFGRGTLGIRGCCLLVRKSLFHSVQGFRQTLTEDAELSFTLLDLGYKTKYEPRAFAETSEYETVPGFFRHMNRSIKGIVFTFLRHKRSWLFSRQSLVSYVYTVPITLISYLSEDYSVLLPLLFSALVIPLKQIMEIFFGTFLLTLVKTGAMTLVFVFHLTTMISREIRAFRNFYLIPVLFLFLPVISLAFLKGFLSALLDKALRRPELRFQDWKI
jgi:cellulose synthase/poly-beta-1,6-N-acetylglucosamine synthase-like glycosyltransferase